MILPISYPHRCSNSTCYIPIRYIAGAIFQHKILGSLCWLLPQVKWVEYKEVAIPIRYSYFLTSGSLQTYPGLLLNQCDGDCKRQCYCKVCPEHIYSFPRLILQLLYMTIFFWKLKICRLLGCGVQSELKKKGIYQPSQAGRAIISSFYVLRPFYAYLATIRF